MSGETSHSTIAVLISGGLDSSILLGHLLRQGRHVQPLYIRCGLAWQDEELRAVERFLDACRTAGPGNAGVSAAEPGSADIVSAEPGSADILSAKGGRDARAPSNRDARTPSGRDLCNPDGHGPEPLVVLDLPVRDLYGDHWSVTGDGVPDAQSADDAVYLPGRNALLIVKAAVWCRLHGIGELALAVLNSNPFADATPAFFAEFESALARAMGGRVRIVRPFAAMSKREVMALGSGLPLEFTFSCIAPQDGRHCGACNKCAERQAAFETIDSSDPTESGTLLEGVKDEG